MIICKDTAFLNQDKEFDSLKGKTTITTKQLLIVDQEVGKNMLLLKYKKLGENETFYLKINRKDLTINYGDVTRDIYMPLLLEQGWSKKELINHK